MYRLVLGPLVLALLAAVAGCRGGPPPREFEIVGQIQALAPERGRFRSYLMAVCAHHIADCRVRDRAAKRRAAEWHADEA